MEKTYPPCLLCGIKPATKTNSHIIPSFMVASVCSYDGSGKRDKEVMFTMSTYEDRIYTGAIPSTKLSFARALSIPMAPRLKPAML